MVDQPLEAAYALLMEISKLLYVSGMAFEGQAQKMNMSRLEESTTKHDGIETEILDGLCDPVHSIRGTVMTPSAETEDGGGVTPSMRLSPPRRLCPRRSLPLLRAMLRRFERGAEVTLRKRLIPIRKLNKPERLFHLSTV